MATNQEPVNWARLIENGLNMAITVIGNKLQGVKAPVVQEGAAVSTPIGSASNFFVVALLSAAVVGAVLIFRK